MNRLAVLAIVSTLALSGCVTKPPSVSEPVAVGVTLRQLETAIETSLDRRNWKIIEHTPGRYVAKIDARDNQPVLIAVAYDNRTYSINWVDSGKSFGGRHSRVQKSYARWIEILRKDIEGRL